MLDVVLYGLAYVSCEYSNVWFAFENGSGSDPIWLTFGRAEFDQATTMKNAEEILPLANSIGLLKFREPANSVETPSQALRRDNTPKMLPDITEALIESLFLQTKGVVPTGLKIECQSGADVPA